MEGGVSKELISSIDTFATPIQLLLPVYVGKLFYISIQSFESRIRGFFIKLQDVITRYHHESNISLLNLN